MVKDGAGVQRAPNAHIWFLEVIVRLLHSIILFNNMDMRHQYALSTASTEHIEFYLEQVVASKVEGEDHDTVVSYFSSSAEE